MVFRDVPVSVDVFGRESDPDTYDIIGAAIEVHRFWGPGFLEAVYKKSLAIELRRQGFEVQLEVPFPLAYKGEDLGTVYRADLMCSGILVELKATSGLHEHDIAQVVHYLRASGISHGLLLNFGLPVLQKRRVIADGADSARSVGSVLSPSEPTVSG